MSEDVCLNVLKRQLERTSWVHNNNFKEKKGAIVKFWSQFLQKVLAFSARALLLFPTASFLGPYSIFNSVDVAVPTARAQRQAAVAPHADNLHVSHRLPTMHSMDVLTTRMTDVLLWNIESHFSYTW